MNVPVTDTTWLDACVAFACAHRVPDTVLEVLAAFATPWPRGGPPAPPEMPWAADFEALERELTVPISVEAVTQVLESESRSGQPAMFARRLAATEKILRKVATPAARILRVGLRVRLAGMQVAAPPRLIRVRALADFYYSQAARLRYAEDDRATVPMEQALADLVWEHVGAGIEHATFDGRAEGMPVHVNLLRVDPRETRIAVVDLTSATRGGQSMAEAVGARTVAAISGGFFLYSEPEIEPPSRKHDPVGLLVIDGDVRSPPVFARPSLLAAEGGEVELRVVRLEDVAMRIGGRPVRLDAHWNRSRAEVGPDGDGVAVVGSRVVAVGRSLPVPLNGFVATLDGVDAAAIAPGDAVTYEPPQLASGAPASVGVAGGPTLVRGGQPVLEMRAEEFWGTAPPITFSQDETGDRNLLARMAVGLDGADRLVAAAVDGRNVERALGMTLGGVARLLIHLGCTSAMNLDGGSSKRMVIHGRVVDLPSTEIISGEADVVRVRPVHSAILFQAR